MLPSQYQKLALQRCSLTNCNNLRRRQLYHIYQTSTVQLQNLIENKRLLSSSSSSTKNSNYVHPYALLNQNNYDKHRKNNKAKRQNVHPYKRLIEERGHNNKHVNSSKASSLPLSRALEPYRRLNQTNKMKDTHSASSSKSEAADHHQEQHLQQLSIKTDANSIESYANLLSKCTLISDKLIHKQSLLSPPPITWLQQQPQNHYDDIEYIERMNQYKDVHKLLNIILQESFMKQMNELIDSPSHNVQTLQLLNSLFTNCLIICSKSLPPKYWNVMSWNSGCDDSDNHNNGDQQHDDVRTIRTPMHCSVGIYHLLQTFNLDIQPIHYDCIIRTANFDYHDSDLVIDVNDINTSTNTYREGNNHYEFVSKLFKKQINIDQSGYVPIDSMLGWDKSVEMGLYSIAMNASHKLRISSNVDYDSDDMAMSVAKEVMDAVEEMCMVSPTDQERCK
jgi:hypothetical protein